MNKTKKSILSEINDIFVISTSGIPYYAKCFGGDICKDRPDHLLQCGFIAGLFQFSHEFGQSGIKEVIFESGKMIFEKIMIHNEPILVVFFTTCKPKTKQLRTNLHRTAQAFIEKYDDKFMSDGKLHNVNSFSDFTDTLINLQLINRDPMGSIDL